MPANQKKKGGGKNNLTDRHSSTPTKRCSCGVKVEGVSMTKTYISKVIILTAGFKSHLSGITK
jgi:hypothetical protein